MKRTPFLWFALFTLVLAIFLKHGGADKADYQFFALLSFIAFCASEILTSIRRER